MKQVKKKSSLKRILQILSAVLITLSALPCLLTIFNIPPVILYATKTGGNAALQIYFPLITAALINGTGLVLLLISLFLKEHKLANHIQP
jgi:hypothetical protein